MKMDDSNKSLSMFFNSTKVRSEKLYQFKVCAVYVAHLDLRRAVPQDRSVFNIQKYM